MKSSSKVLAVVGGISSCVGVLLLRRVYSNKTKLFRNSDTADRYIRFSSLLSDEGNVDYVLSNYSDKEKIELADAIFSVSLFKLALKRSEACSCSGSNEFSSMCSEEPFDEDIDG